MLHNHIVRTGIVSHYVHYKNTADIILEFQFVCLFNAKTEDTVNLFLNRHKWHKVRERKELSKAIVTEHY